MPDWATEKAMLMFSVARDNLAEETNEKIISRIAFDLREAKADGECIGRVKELREAAEYLSATTNAKCFAEYFRDRADRIERGEDA